MPSHSVLACPRVLLPADIWYLIAKWLAKLSYTDVSNGCVCEHLCQLQTLALCEAPNHTRAAVLDRAAILSVYYQTFYFGPSCTMHPVWKHQAMQDVIDSVCLYGAMVNDLHLSPPLSIGRITLPSHPRPMRLSFGLGILLNMPNLCTLSVDQHTAYLLCIAVCHRGAAFDVLHTLSVHGNNEQITPILMASQMCRLVFALPALMSLTCEHTVFDGTPEVVPPPAYCSTLTRIHVTSNHPSPAFFLHLLAHTTGVTHVYYAISMHMSDQLNLHAVQEALDHHVATLTSCTLRLSHPSFPSGTLGLKGCLDLHAFHMLQSLTVSSLLLDNGFGADAYDLLSRLPSPLCHLSLFMTTQKMNNALHAIFSAGYLWAHFPALEALTCAHGDAPGNWVSMLKKGAVGEEAFWTRMKTGLPFPLYVQARNGYVSVNYHFNPFNAVLY